MAHKVLLVYAHHHEGSFNSALRDVAVTTLKSQNCQVTVSDLYAMKFNPVISKKDFKGKIENPETYNYPMAAGAAWKKGELQKDVLAEQKKVTESDLIILQFPIQWMSAPAILKGWLERVLLYGFSFTSTENFDKGLLKGKKVLCSITTGVPEKMLTPLSPMGSIHTNLWPLINGTLRFVGLDILPLQVSYGVGSLTKEGREQLLADYKDRLLKIWDEPPMTMTSYADFEMVDPDDASKGFKFKSTKEDESVESTLCRRFQFL